MTNNGLKEKLVPLLDKLKRNKASVPHTELKTKYKAGYEKLCKEISTLSSLYVSQTAFHGLRIRKDLCSEAAALANQAIKDSGLRHQIAAAVFIRQDMEELESLILQLRCLVLESLESLYIQNTCLFLTNRCLDNLPDSPILYNAATGYVWTDND